MELYTLLTSSKTKFYIRGISELSLQRNNQHATNLDLPNYNFEHCDSEGANGETLL